MAGKSVSFNSTCKLCKDYFSKFSDPGKQKINNTILKSTSRATSAALNLYESQAETIAKWLSCNSEVWGVGPTVVFASAAALFLYNELEATVFMPGDQIQVSVLEKTLISTMMLGMLALMIHLWVCSMRFFQYYLDTVIRDSPSMLLEMTTAGLLGGQSEIVPLGPLTRFLRQQQPQIHITVCWFLSLCYADYVRKHYCQRFNMPYLEQWQAELHERFVRSTHQVMQKVNSFVGSLHQRLRGYAQTDAQIREANNNQMPINTEMPAPTVPVLVPETAGNERLQLSCSDKRVFQPSTTSSELSKDHSVRLVGQSSDTTAVAIERLRNFFELFEQSKCGESPLSALPTVLWAAGAAALAQRLIVALFRRFVFRRVPVWELVLQHLLFLWIVIYSVRFWGVLVRVLKALVEYCYENENDGLSEEDIDSCNMMQQWIIWICGIAPLALYIQTRPRPEAPPLMIWITTSPWQRREMGPYGYYLNRPLSSLPSTTNMSPRQQALTLRRAFSDSKIIIKEPTKKKKVSKSI